MAHMPARATSAVRALQTAPAVGSNRYDTLPPVLDLLQAAALLGLGRTTAYRLIHDDEWPTPVFRLGRLIKVPTQPLLDLLAGRPPIAATGDDDVDCAHRVSSTGPRSIGDVSHLRHILTFGLPADEDGADGIGR